MIAHYQDTKSNTFFIQLINLKQRGLVGEHIENFQIFNINIRDIPEEQLTNVFIGTLKDNIKHENFLQEPKSLEHAFRVARKIQNKIMATRKYTTYNIKEGSVVSSHPQPTRLMQQQIEEKSEEGIFYSCDIKYGKGHKCIEKNLFYIDFEEEENEQEASKEEDSHQEQTSRIEAK